MAILDIQRRQRELGRIRMGDKGGKGQPQKLSEFRLTSPARHLLEHAAALWGGEVREWPGSPSEGQYELYTKTDTLPIVIPPSAEPVSQWYEQWSAGGCTHRCDGARNHITETPCSCDADNRACKATTRINVMLPDLPDVGVWRLETHGINAAYELPGTIDVIQMSSATGRFLTGRLRIEHRTSKKAGQTRKFIVPVIDLDVTMGALMSGEVQSPSLGTGGGELPDVVPPVAALPSGQASDEPSDGSGDTAEGSPRTITQPQIARMMAVAKEHDVTVEDLKLVVRDIAGVASRKDIPAERYDAVIAALSGEMVTNNERMEDPA